MILDGLTSDTGRKRNGSLGKIVGETEDRFVVELIQGGAKLKVKAVNLREPSPDEVAKAESRKTSFDKKPTTVDEALEDFYAKLRDQINARHERKTNDMCDDSEWRLRILEAQDAIAKTTDVAYNAEHLFDDGDQSFVRATLDEDDGAVLRRARCEGMDLLPERLSPFALACLYGDVGKVGEY